jgi:tetratricopeptide (TPR) repeat protein
MSSLLFSTAFLFLTPEAAAPIAPQPPLERSYEICAERVLKNVKEGREFAARWVADVGGVEAMHCLALADLRAGFPKLAAVRLEELSEREDAGDHVIRARILSQAALAYLEGKETQEAARAIAAAFAMAPDDDELYLPAAKVYAAEEKRNATIEAVTTAETRGRVSAEGFVLRGRARYALADYRDAADDVVGALKLDPTNLDALVLRGDLAQQGIDVRADYSKALRQKGKKNR